MGAIVFPSLTKTIDITTHPQFSTMRAIERWTLSAIQEGRDFRRANTEVLHDYRGDGGLRRTSVKLYGNTIATIYPDRIEACDCGQQTQTTKSRLNAILMLCGDHAGFYQKQFSWYRSDNGELVEPGSVQTFPR